jgi:hypothetical protein
LFASLILASAYTIQHSEDDRSSLTWFVTVFIFVAPSAQGLVDCVLFFESRIVNRRAARRANELKNRPTERIKNKPGGSRGGLFRERVSDYVFENFAVPNTGRSNRSDVDSEDLSKGSGLSSQDSVNLGSEVDDLNDIDLDSLDGDFSDDDGGGGDGVSKGDNYRHRSYVNSRGLHGNFGVTDIDDHGVEFRSLGGGVGFGYNNASEARGRSNSSGRATPDVSMLTDHSNLTPVKSASDPIDLISF